MNIYIIIAKFIIVAFFLNGLNSCVDRIKQEDSIECISIESKNILYIGVPNMVSVKGYNGSESNLVLRYNEKIHDPKSEHTFDIRVERLGIIEIEVLNLPSNTVLASYTFRAKHLPLPTPSLSYVANNKDKIGKKELMAQKGIASQILNWGYKINCPIKQFTVLSFTDEIRREASANGPHFNDKQKDILESLHSGDYLIIMDIIAQLPHGELGKLQPLVYKIK